MTGKTPSGMKSKLASSQGGDLASRAREVKGAKVLAVSIEEADSRVLRETLDKFKDKFKSGIVVLGAIEDGRVKLIAGVPADLTPKVKAGGRERRRAPGHGSGGRNRARQSALSTGERDWLG